MGLNGEKNIQKLLMKLLYFAKTYFLLFTTVYLFIFLKDYLKNLKMLRSAVHRFCCCYPQDADQQPIINDDSEEALNEAQTRGIVGFD